MKKLLFLLPVLAIAVLLACKLPDGADKGIKFYDASWNDVMQKAKKENKPIFLDIYASWCGPCKLLKKKTFVDKEVGEYFNTHFISASFDGEKGDGVMLASKFQIQGYPSLMILNPDGTVINATLGYLEPADLLQFAKQSTVKGPRH